MAGVTTGFMELSDSMTWEARHFGITQRLTAKITAFDRPRMFVDEMTAGAFKRWHHTHLFREAPHEDARANSARPSTLMIDIVDFASPLGPLGRLVDRLVLTRYMTRLLTLRNNHSKALAERGR